MNVGDKNESGGGWQSAADPPPASPVLAHYIAEARKKVEEVRKTEICK